MDRHALTLSGLGRRYGSTDAVKAVSVTIPPGQFVGVIGPSGAGKSTLLRMINRLTDPTDGRILYGETDVTALSGKRLRQWRRNSAMVFQQFHLVDRLNVLTNVLIGTLANHGLISSMLMRFSDEERAEAIRALDRLQLAHRALQRVDTLSGGQQQRVAIARALLQKPKLMLADEPIASLDPGNATRVMNALRAIRDEDGITVLVNLHTLDTARAYCDRIIGMRAGRIVFDGPPRELTAEVAHDLYGGAYDEAITSTAVPRPVEADARPRSFA